MIISKIQRFSRKKHEKVGHLSRDLLVTNFKMLKKL